MSQLADLNNEEREAIEELRMRVKNIMPADMYEDVLLFRRFLIARDFDIDKAEIMLRKNIIWRKIYQIDTYLEDFKPSPVFLNYVNGTYIGQDKEGCLMFYSHAGRTDTRDVVKCFKGNEYFKHWIWTIEQHLAKLKEVNAKTGRNISKFSYILDMDGLELANAAHPTTSTIYMRIAQLYQDNYPERLKAFYLINVPSYYIIIYSLVKRILAAEVIRKIHVYGKTGWKEEILKLADPDNLPAFLGGKITDPDGNPMCHTFVRHCGRIPSKYFLSKEDRSFKDESRVQHINVAPRMKHEVSVEVKEYGSVIQWEYELKSRDIGFGIYFKESGEEFKEIIPVFRLETPDGTETGSCRCQEIGTYTIIFDNTFSRFNSKDVSYCITVMKSREISKLSKV